MIDLNIDHVLAIGGISAIGILSLYYGKDASVLTACIAALAGVLGASIGAKNVTNALIGQGAIPK